MLRFSHRAILMTLISLPVIADSNLEQIVVTASRSEQSVAEVGSNITAVDQLEGIGQVHINETLQRVPGVWISRGNGQEHLTAIRSPVLTGAGGCGAFLMAQDSVPLRASGFCNVNELFDVNSEQAERIEVVKGPGSVLYGSNAMHGMVNVITPEPNPRNQLSLEGGVNDYYRAKLSASGESWRADVNGTHDGGYKHASGFDQQKATFKYKRAISGFDTSSVLSLSNLNQETAGFIKGDKVYENGHLSRQNPNPEAYRDNQTLRLYSRMEREVGEGKITLTPYIRSTKMKFIQHFLPGQAIEENRHSSIGLQSAYYGNAWTFGIDLEKTQASLKEYQPNATGGSPFLVATIPAGDHYDYEVDASTVAVFARYQTNITERTRITLGARAERVAYDYDNRMLDGRVKDDGTTCGFGGCRFNRPADRDDSFTNVSPRIDITHSLSSDHQIYSQLARGYRAPQATELYRLQGGQNINNIDPEVIDSFEIGIRGQINNLSYETSTYVMKKDNFIFRDTNRATVDNGKTSHKGIELNLQYAVSEQLTTAFVASYAKHQYENNPALSSSNIKGNDIDTAPRTTGSARVNWQILPSVETELEVIYLGSYYEDPENQHEYDGHRLINLRVKHTLSDNSNIFLRIMNLSNETYAERADYSFGSDRYFVGQPISIYAGYTANF